MSEYAFHPIADCWPWMPDEAFNALAEDIKLHGLYKDIELYEGKILDGRNRYKACKSAGVPPRFTEINPSDPVAYVISANNQRRHCTMRQNAMAAARARDWFDERAKKRQEASLKQNTKNRGDLLITTEDKGKSRDQVGKAFGVSGASVERATHILKTGNQELIDAVDQDKVSLNRADKIAHAPREDQPVMLAEALSEPRSKADKPKRKTVVRLTAERRTDILDILNQALEWARMPRQATPIGKIADAIKQAIDKVTVLTPVK